MLFRSEQAGVSGSSTGTAAAGTVTRTGVSVFSPFSLANIAADENPLPVKFGGIKCYPKNDGVQVEWEIYTEENVSHYEVGRSASGGSQFIAIGSVVAGNNPGRSMYNFFDAAPLLETGFYRIKNIDIDGKFSYSSIIRIEPGKKDGVITIYPNPVKDRYLSFRSGELEKGDYTIKIYDANNRRQLHIAKLKHTGGFITQTIQLPALNAGMYFMQINSGNSRF